MNRMDQLFFVPRIDLFPQKPDVDRDRVGGGLFVLPDRLLDLLSAEDMPLAGGERFEQIVLAVAQPDLCARPHDPALHRVNRKIRDLDHPRLVDHLAP
jgi:hypothetical protein